MTRPRWSSIVRVSVFAAVFAPAFFRPGLTLSAVSRIDWLAVTWAAGGLVAALLFLIFVGGCLWLAVVQALSKAG